MLSGFLLVRSSTLNCLVSANSIILVVQRLVVAASCIILYILTIRVPIGKGGKAGMLILLAFLACIEKLCSIMNMVSVEKDWVRHLSKPFSYAYSLQGLAGCRCMPK